MSMLESRRSATGLAAALAGIVACSLITASPPGGLERTKPPLWQVDSHVVQLEAATASKLGAGAVTATAAVAAIARTSAPATATSPSATAAVSLAAIAADVKSVILRTVATSLEIAIIGVTGLIAPVWYLSAPITLPLTYVIAPHATFCLVSTTSCYDAPPTPLQHALGSVVVFLFAPYLAVNFLLSAENNWLSSTFPDVFPPTAAQATKPVSAAATATATSVVNKRIERLGAVVNTAKTLAVATQILQGGAPKLNPSAQTTVVRSRRRYPSSSTPDRPQRTVSAHRFARNEGHIEDEHSV
jgi:hypothetical protein